MVRRSNVHFKLTVLKQLTLLAMASIDANYWTKCIQHMFKEIDYYIYYDNIDTGENNNCLQMVCMEENHDKFKNMYQISQYNLKEKYNTVMESILE